MYYVADSTSILFSHQQRAQAQQWLVDNPGDGRQLLEPVVALTGPDPAVFPVLVAERAARKQAQELIHPFLAYLRETRGLALLPAIFSASSEDDPEITEAYMNFREIDRPQALAQYATYLQQSRPTRSRQIERVLVNLESGEETSLGSVGGK